MGPQTMNHLHPRGKYGPSAPKGFDWGSLINAMQAIGQLAPVLGAILQQVIDALRPKALRAASQGDNACNVEACLADLRKAHDAYHAALEKVEADPLGEDACAELGKAVCDMVCAYLCLHACHADHQAGAGQQKGGKGDKSVT